MDLSNNTNFLSIVSQATICWINASQKITCKLDGCTKRHHTLLHRSKVIQPAKSSPLVGQNNGKNHHSSISKIALLQTIPVILFNGNYEIQINALLDSASDVTLTHEAGA